MNEYETHVDVRRAKERLLNDRVFARQPPIRRQPCGSAKGVLCGRAMINWMRRASDA